MKSMMVKTTLREIKQSLGRYLAIMGIVALGVGFFAGLKATTPAMLKTAEIYWDEKQLYDFRLICTLGFGDAEVAEIASRDDVRVAQGAYSFDILCQSSSDGNMEVMKAHSITEGVNGLEIVAGRLPKNANECVVDSGVYSEKYIGKKLKLSELNEKEDLENFTYTEYKIVGIVNASYYSQFERGNTSLGSGSIAGFVYLLPEGFDSDAYTEVFVKLNEDFPLYSEEYDAYIEEKEPEWEAFLEELGNLRYENVIIEANEKLADAKKELADGKAEGEEELREAKEKLDEAAAEIEDGKQQLADGKADIEAGLRELEDAEKELDDGAREIAKNEKLLLEKEQELADGEAAWQENSDALTEALSQIESGEAALPSAEAQILAGESQLAEKEADLIAGEKQLETMEALVDGLLTEMDEQKEVLAQLEALEQSGILPENMQELLVSTRAGIEALKVTLENAQTELETNRATLEAGRVQIEAAKKQLADARKQYENGKKQLADGRTQAEDGEKQLSDAWTTIQDGKKQLRDGRLELVKARQEIEDGRRELEKAREELEAGREEIAEKEQELLDGEQEYLDGLAEYEDGLAEFETEIADAEAEIAEAEESLKDIEKPEQYLLGRDTNVGYVCFENDSNIVDRISDVFPVFFFLVAALVCMTTMSRMIEEQRTQIGALKALGYSRRTIMNKYIFYSGSAALIGCVLGFAIGIIIFPYVIWVCYGMMYSMGRFYFVFDWKMAVFSLGVSLLCSAGVTWYGCRKEMNEVAAQLMRPKTPQAGKRIFLEYIPFIWKHLKFLQKVSIRNVLRYKKRFMMMVLGISGCTALVLAAFGINDSVSEVVSQQYKEITIYDMSVNLKDGMDAQVQSDLDAIMQEAAKEYCVVMESAVDLQTEDGIKSVYLVMSNQPESLTNYINMHTLKKEPIALPQKGEAVITHKIAEDYHLEIGDVIELQDNEFRTISVTISNIMQNFVSSYVYIHPDTYVEQLGEEPEYKAAYVNLAEDEAIDAHQVSAALMKLDCVTSVTVNADTMERFESMMASIDYIVILVILCAAALAFIVIYNLTNINITERIREIATIKVLGFYKNETATYVFRENLILTFVGSVVGLGLGKLLHLFIMECLKIDMVAFDNRITGISYLYSVLLTFLFAMCVNKMMSGKLERISMTESLKSVD